MNTMFKTINKVNMQPMAGDGVTQPSGSVDCYVKLSVKLMGHKGKYMDIKTIFL